MLLWKMPRRVHHLQSYMNVNGAMQVAEEPATRRRGKRMTSPERWEVTQLIKSGVLDVTEYPDFDDENGQVSFCKWFQRGYSGPGNGSGSELV